MSIVSSETIKTYTGLSATDYTNWGTYIHTAVEAFVKHYAGPIESTTYTNRLVDGSGGQILRLDVFPIISVKSIALSLDDVIQIKNTMTDSSLASVVVDSTNVTLTVEGGSGNGSDTLAKATYTTCTLLVDAINAQSANGWSAQIVNAVYNSLKTAYLIDQQLECAQDEGTAQSWQELKLAHNFASGFTINKEMGEIYYSSGFPRGFQNIAITLTAGYATPSSECADLYWWIMNAVKTLATKKSNDVDGVTRWQVGDISMTYGALKEAGIDVPMDMFAYYKEKIVRI